MKTIKDQIVEIIENNNDSINYGLRIELTGQEMLDMGWDIGDDSPEDEYELVVFVEDDYEKINCSILCDNGEYSDSGFSFDYEDTLRDLEKNGYIR